VAQGKLSEGFQLDRFFTSFRMTVVFVQNDTLLLQNGTLLTYW